MSTAVQCTQELKETLEIQFHLTYDICKAILCMQGVQQGLADLGGKLAEV
jgi:hypothetical protein